MWLSSLYSTSTYLNNMAWLFLSFSFRPKEVTRVGRCGSVSYSVSHLKPLGTIWAEFPTVVEIIMIPGLSECIIITIAHHLSFCRRWCYNWEISCIKSTKIYNHWMIIIIMGIKLIFGYLIVRQTELLTLLLKENERKFEVFLSWEYIPYIYLNYCR